MKAAEIIAQLRQTFNELVKSAEVPQAPATEPAGIKAKLQDGTEITISEMEIGGVVTKDGLPVPAGSHTLEDGTVINTGENGVITEIVLAAAPAAAPSTAPEPTAMVSELTEKFHSFQSQAAEKFTAYEARFEEYEKRLAKATKVIEGLLNLTQTLAETPTGAPDPAIKGAQIFSTKPEKTEANYDILFS